MDIARVRPCAPEQEASLSPSRSATAPTSGCEIRSPNRWIAKIDTAIAFARSEGGTDIKMAAFVGDVLVKMASSLKPSIARNTNGVPAISAAAASGAAITDVQAHTRRQTTT